MAEPRQEPRLEPQKGPSPIQPPSFTWEPRDAGAALSGGRPDQMPVSDRSEPSGSRCCPAASCAWHALKLRRKNAGSAIQMVQNGRLGIWEPDVIMREQSKKLKKKKSTPSWNPEVPVRKKWAVRILRGSCAMVLFWIISGKD